MGLLTDLGNVFHAIGSFITGGDNNNAPSQPVNQPKPQQPVSPNTVGGLPLLKTPTNQPAPQPQAPSNTTNLFQPPAALPAAKPTAPAPQPQVSPQEIALDNTIGQPYPGEPIGDQVAGAYNHSALGQGLNFLKGVVQGVPQAAIRIGNTIASGITGQDTQFDINNPVAQALIGAKQLGTIQDYGKQTLGSLPIVGKDLNGAPVPVQDAVGGLLTAANLLPVPAGKILDAVKGGATAVDATDAADESLAAAPDEVAVGVKSANPDQVTDAATQIAQKQAAIAPAGAVETTPGTPELAQPGTLSTPVENTPPVSQPVETTPLQPQSPENLKTSSLPNNVPQTENVIKGETAPNAPNVRAQLTKVLGDAGKNAGDVTEHNVLSNDALKSAANNVVQNTPDAELLTKYSGVPDLTKAQDLAHAHASLPKLAELSKSADEPTAKAAKQAIDNVLEGTERGVSGAGRTMNYAQGMYDALPREAKVSATIRQLDKARDAAGMPKIADNLPLRAEVETKINNLLAQGEDLKNQQAAIAGKAEAIQDHIKTNAGNVAPAVKKAYQDEVNTLQAQKAAVDTKAAAQNGDTARYYNSLVPGKAGLQKAADFARTSMLTAPSGRVNNLFNVGGNSLYEIARSIPQTVLNKVVNAVKGGGTTQGKSLLNTGLNSGLREGLARTASEFKGNELVGDLKNATSKNPDTGNLELKVSSNNTGFNRIGNLTRAAVRAPSNIIGGAMKGAQLQRSAAQEAESLGLKGAEAKIYTQARTITPSKEMLSKAQTLQDQVSHMNKNPLADLTGKIFNDKAANNSQLKGVLGIVKNTFLPFPKYASTFLWNTLTDRNIVADTVKAATAIKRGDLDGLTKAVSGGALDTAGMYVGYHLANMGLITTNNGEGYNDDGAYLHLGDRYIPLGFLGVAGESLLAGKGIFDATTTKGSNPVGQFFSTVTGTIFNTIKMAGAQSLVGADNTAISTVQNAITGKDNVSPADAAAAVGGEAAGTFIPGVFSDVNAGLNQTPLDPTHEAAQTDITKGSQGVMLKSGAPSTARSIPASTLAGLENRLPGVSQTLPRNAGTTSTDLVDRVTRGDHIGDVQQAAIDKTANAASEVQDAVKAGVPVYNAPKGTYPTGITFDDVVESTVESGNYGKAIIGLQSKLTALNSTKDEPATAKTPVENQIKQLQVMQKLNVPADFRSTYSGTTLTQWRDMGDPTSSTYNPKLYQQLYSYDQALANDGIAGGSDTTPGKSSTAKFYPSTSSSSGSGSSSSKASTLVKDNKVGSLPALAREDFTTNLKATPISVKIPQVPLTKPGTLIAQHKISVKSPTA